MCGFLLFMQYRGVIEHIGTGSSHKYNDYRRYNLTQSPNFSPYRQPASAHICKDPSVRVQRLRPLQGGRGAPPGRPQPARGRLGASWGAPRRRSRVAEIGMQAQRSRGGGARPLGRPVGRRHRRARSMHAGHACARATAIGGGRDSRAAALSGRCARIPPRISHGPGWPLPRIMLLLLLLQSHHQGLQLLALFYWSYWAAWVGPLAWPALLVVRLCASHDHAHPSSPSHPPRTTAVDSSR